MQKKIQKCRMLADVLPGQRARIRCHHGCGAIRQRLLDLGFVPETEISMI
ncbi:FeoA family protein, partial [Desulfobulbus alkaliphilus]